MITSPAVDPVPPIIVIEPPVPAAGLPDPPVMVMAPPVVPELPAVSATAPPTEVFVPPRESKLPVPDVTRPASNKIEEPVESDGFVPPSATKKYGSVALAPSTVNRAFGDVDATPIRPELIIESVDVPVDVAKFDGDDVAMKRFPAIERNVHGEFVDEPSVSASCGAVDDEIVSAKRGDVVPIPTTAFVRFV
jgi:hypothetical protein